MALINCPECQNEISEHAKTCPHCGYHIKQKNFLSNKKIKKVLYIVIIAAIISISLILFLLYHLSPYEQIAVTNVNDLRNMLKDPDSFKLYEDVLVIWYTDLAGDYCFYTYIDYSAKNSYGAMVRSTAMYKGYSYVGNMEDIDDLKKDLRIKESIEPDSVSTKEMRNKILDLLSAQIPYLEYNVKVTHEAAHEELPIKNYGVKKVINVNKNKIMRVIKLQLF